MKVSFIILAAVALWVASAGALSSAGTVDFKPMSSKALMAFADAYKPADIVYGRGCCSHHGGQNHCNTAGKWVCSDGWTSSCDCD